MMDIRERKEWLQGASDKLMEIVDAYEGDPFSAGCDDFDDLIARAYVIATRLKARAKMYDEPAIANAQSDAWLRKAAVDFVYARAKGMQKYFDDAAKGNALSNEQIENAHAWIGCHAELHFIFQCTMRGGCDDV